MKYTSTNIPLQSSSVLTQEQLVNLLNTFNCFNADVNDSELLATFGYTGVSDINTPQPTSTSIVVADKNDSNEFYLKWIEEQDYIELKRKAVNGNAIRRERNKLLSQTDWTQCKDASNELSIKWTSYRQALRDITSQEGFPDTVTWPTPPQ